jgi:Undecaprenyl-phosphate galactose phosphotransferase WbaP
MLARDFGGEIAFELPQRLFHRNSQLAKRAVDILVSGVAIIALLPLFLLIALLVRLASPGPIFYGQGRLGKHGRTFRALKFRTMVPNADALLTTYLASHPESHFEWERDHKLKNDPRVTKIGKWLRMLSLDELPQLLNVFLGDMSLVGPRPIVQAEIRRYGDGYDLYKRVRPGITGLWQVSGRNNTTYDERVTFDEYYVHNWSIWLDLYVLARTVKVVLTADGAY